MKKNVRKNTLKKIHKLICEIKKIHFIYKNIRNAKNLLFSYYIYTIMMKNNKFV